MSTGLLQQLNAYYEQVSDSQEPITDTELRALLEAPTSLTPDSKTPNRRGAWVAVAAAIGTLLLVGGVALLVGRESDVAVSDDLLPGTSVPTPNPTSSPATTLSVTSGTSVEWTTVSTDGFAEGAVLDDVAYGRGVYVAVGGVGLAPNQDAAVWVSQDGIDWTRVSDPAGHFGGDGPQEIRAVVFGDHRFVAVGEDWLAAVGSDDVPLDAPDLAVWVSEDGLSWTRVADVDGTLGGPGGQSLGNAYDLAYGDAGYVFLGSERLPKPYLVSWVSPDGITWSRETLCSEDSCSQEGLAELGDVGFDEVVVQALAYGNGIYLAIGGLQGGAPLVLLSDDGLQWRVPVNLQGLADGALLDVTYSHGRFVATGWNWTVGYGAIWTSVDGVSWDLVVEDESHPVFDLVASDGNEIIVMSKVFRSRASAVYWHSGDGIVWTRSTFDPAVPPSAGSLFLKAAAVANRDYVVIGGENLTPQGPADTLTYIIWKGQRR